MNFNKNVQFSQIEKYEDLRKSSPQKSMGGCALASARVFVGNFVLLPVSSRLESMRTNLKVARERGRVLRECLVL